MKINIPGTAQAVLLETGGFQTVWYTLFNNLIKRVLGNQDAYMGAVVNNNITSTANTGSSATDFASVVTIPVAHGPPGAGTLGFGCGPVTPLTFQ